MPRLLSIQKLRRAQSLRLKARQAELARLREERGATDPILIIAGIAITLILLVGGSFAISGFIANANNLNAKGDLDRIATAQAAYLAQNDRYGALSVGPSVSAQNTELQNGAIGFTPTAGNNIKVSTSPSGWTAVTKSASGDIYLRTSQSTQIFQLSSDASNPQYGAAQENTRNLFRNPDAATMTDLNYWSAASTINQSNVAAAWSANGKAMRATYTVLGSTYGGPAPFVMSGYTLGQKMTLAFKLYSTRAFTIGMPSVDQSNGNPLAVVVHGRSNQQNVPANTPVVVYVTFTATGNPADLSLSNLRVHSGVTNIIAGQSIEVSEFDFYAGDYQSGRTFFSGASAGNASTVYGWAGAANNSASIKSIRPVIANMPSGVSLPIGISWEQVGADAAEVQ